jgi:hypothetical protein
VLFSRDADVVDGQKGRGRSLPQPEPPRAAPDPLRQTQLTHDSALNRSLAQGFAGSAYGTGQLAERLMNARST